MSKTRILLNFALCGLSVWWWHACNIALHAACCVLVARTGAVVARLRRPFAALAALLFAVHPIHSEAVSRLSTYILHLPLLIFTTELS
ncbi:Transmembrane and TPR repeat-containing protein 3 [Danaus plexippus plexippus]|uniref:Transmembrane and TPR repeat-containing protein 3 n=1 Tax=Danaus plexippus plexippus TaxID=278856 RepID=A0A212F6G2_DANPL|nr:Transmembrane and TPR repeat-containing protein 3 [Danaus plexippus plexippus]